MPMTKTPIYTAEDGRTLALDDLTDTTSEASENTANISEDAIEHFNEGVELGRKNELKAALSKFSAATAQEPKWPYPIYQRAFTLLLLGETDKALACYKKVDELEPRGFYNSKHALSVVQREAAGEYPTGLYLHYVGHEWLKTDDEKRALMEEIAEIAPDFSAAYLTLAGLQRENKERRELIEFGLKHKPDQETRGMLLLNKAAIHNLDNDKTTAIGILGDLILDATSTASVVAIAKAILFDMHAPSAASTSPS